MMASFDKEIYLLLDLGEDKYKENDFFFYGENVAIILMKNISEPQLQNIKDMLVIQLPLNYKKSFKIEFRNKKIMEKIREELKGVVYSCQKQ